MVCVEVATVPPKFRQIKYLGLSERRTKLLPRYRKFTLNHEKSSTSHTPTPLEPHQSNGMVPRVPSLNTERRSVKKNFRQINASGIVPGSCLVGLDESRTTYCHEFRKKLRQIIAVVVGAPSKRTESWSHRLKHWNVDRPSKKIRQIKAHERSKSGGNQ